ncbi:hypothetical protein DPMN_106075 [Dreissena polymorpha]|uniref:Uncharacterized protein n=1 Tax=Dreissena polymorpha TaxID=45954 RepID=A0A9D4K4B6_DREPO|nr:hypothetical protein DPMN_106075 [Dreissena polymorpha]
MISDFSVLLYIRYALAHAKSLLLMSLNLPLVPPMTSMPPAKLKDGSSFDGDGDVVVFQGLLHYLLKEKVEQDG